MTDQGPMDDLDFEGWNNADWQGVFAHQHTDDVYVDFKGQEPARSGRDSAVTDRRDRVRSCEHVRGRHR
jgi:hypothetical protein